MNNLADLLTLYNQYQQAYTAYIHSIEAGDLSNAFTSYYYTRERFKKCLEDHESEVMQLVRKAVEHDRTKN